MREKISKIKSAEDESLRIIETAKNEANSLIESAKQQAKKILETSSLKAKDEARSLLQAEDDSISLKTKELNEKSIAEIDAIRKSADSKIEQAEKHIVNKILEQYSK